MLWRVWARAPASIADPFALAAAACFLQGRHGRQGGRHRPSPCGGKVSLLYVHCIMVRRACRALRSVAPS
jgi:hypothetical protein